ncbi:MAG: DNA mismatch repair endonuclease MutL, partial [bacterium]
MGKIHKLDQKVIDQIAAGEVVERPSSVLKELLENSIDADSTIITVKIRNGGIDYLEVQDKGVGISKDDLDECLNSHSTSKILQIDDIENIDTLGFRGEALSSISSVSTISVVSKERDSEELGGYKIKSIFGDKSETSSASRDVGTTIVVESLFQNIPARKKFLKSGKTEYRKILDVFQKIVLINPHIHFILFNDDKQVFNLPLVTDSQKGTLHPQRVSEIVKNIKLLPIFYDGEGITIGGFVGHPKHFSSRVSDQYIFVNGRGIWDSGIAKSISLGASRYIPVGSKIPFVISITILPHLIDVNVHPQKSEIRFANPYRVYSAVEDAVKKSLSSISKNESDDRESLFRTDKEPSVEHL